jgi:hypothetical protein
LLKALDECRTSASQTAQKILSITLTERELDEFCDKHSLERRTGRKVDKMRHYQLQYVQHKLSECRREFMNTRARNEELRKYLPWYRVLFACFRRIEYGLIDSDENYDI